MSISWGLTNLLATFLLPPANCMVLALVGILLLNRRPRLARFLLFFSVALLWLFSAHAFNRWMLQPLEQAFPAWDGKTPAEAVVVLGAGRYRAAPEYGGGDDVSSRGLERLRYGAMLAKELQLPMLLSGGKPDADGVSEARAMQTALQRDFRFSAHWLEENSRNTEENARESAALLQRAGVRRIVLVTHAWHMPRAMLAFSNRGLEVVPAPMGYVATRSTGFLDYLPRADGLNDGALVLREWIGLGWYSLRR